MNPTGNWTVRGMRIRAKSHGLTGYSRMRKAELVNLLASIRHNVGDVVERACDRKRGVVVEVQNATFEGIDDSSVIVQYDGDTRENATIGAHHAFVFIAKGARKMDRYSHWATSFPLSKYGDGNVCQGHADYCAEYGHATEKSTDLNGVTTVAGHCPRCGDTLMTAEATVAESTPDTITEAVEKADTLDSTDVRDMRDVLESFISRKGREDLFSVLDIIDASLRTGEYIGTRIPMASPDCGCKHDSRRCYECVLHYVASLFSIDLEWKLPNNYIPTSRMSALNVKTFGLSESDCYA
jgi:hypothetical protein